MHLTEMGWSPHFETDPIEMVGLTYSEGNNGSATMPYHDTTSRKLSNGKESTNDGQRPANREGEGGWLKEWTGQAQTKITID